MLFRTEYKGYTVEVIFDERYNLFVGRVLNTNDFPKCYGTTITKIVREFELDIDDYLSETQRQDNEFGDDGERN